MERDDDQQSGNIEKVAGEEGTTQKLERLNGA